MARRRLQFDLLEVESCARAGLTLAQTARLLRSSPRTMVRRLAEDAGFRDAWARGRAGAVRELGEILYEKARAGDFASLRLFLLHAGGWRERAETTVHNRGSVEIVRCTYEQRLAACRAWLVAELEALGADVDSEAERARIDTLAARLATRREADNEPDDAGDELAFGT